MGRSGERPGTKHRKPASTAYVQFREALCRARRGRPLGLLDRGPVSAWECSSAARQRDACTCWLPTRLTLGPPRDRACQRPEWMSPVSAWLGRGCETRRNATPSPAWPIGSLLFGHWQAPDGSRAGRRGPALPRPRLPHAGERRSRHLAGDRVPRVVAMRLSSALGPGNLLARLGGDEFIALPPDVAPQQAPALVATVHVLSPPPLPGVIGSSGRSQAWGSPWRSG